MYTYGSFLACGREEPAGFSYVLVKVKTRSGFQELAALVLHPGLEVLAFREATRVLHP